MLPVALGVIAGLLLGFAAGYGVGQRGAGPDSTEAVQVSQGSPGEPAPEGKAYSEQAVSPPAPVGTTPPSSVPAEPPEAQPDSAPAPADTRPAAPTSGQLVVRSNPPGASVTLDGRWRGRTPLTLEKVPFARHTLRVVQQGYAVSEQEVALTADDPARTVSVELARAPRAASPALGNTARPSPPPARTASAPSSFTGSLYVDSRPRGANVFLDGKRVGTTPMRLPEVSIGSHVVRLELPDHQTWAVSTRVTAGDEARVTGSLDRIR
jgi:hypothetical protein